MPRQTLPIANGFYKSDALIVSNQECINWAPSIVEVQGALSPEILIGTPGITEKINTGSVNQENRGLHDKAGLPYFLNGETLVRVDRTIDVTGTVTFTDVFIGTIPGTENVSSADNGTQLMILVPGGKGYIIDESALPIFQEITDPDFTANGAPQYVEYVDSFFIVTTDTKKFIKSAANDGLSWNALDFGTAEADPDVIVAPIVHRNRLYIAGSETIEDFPNQAAVTGADFPFIRGGLVIPKGVFAPLSLIDVGDTFMFVGGGTNEKAAIWALAGNSVQKVSTIAIDVVLGNLTDAEIGAIKSYNYGLDGAYYICFTLPKTTFCYNTQTLRWHEQKSLILNDQNKTEIVSWRVSGTITAYGLIWCGDQFDGRIGIIEDDVFTEYGELIHRTFSIQPFAAQGNVITVSAIELTVNSGVGDFDKINPEIRMSKSKNNHIFDDEVSRNMGKVGEYDTRLIWRNQGRFPRFGTLRFSMSAAVKPTIVKLEANMRVHEIGS